MKRRDERQLPPWMTREPPVTEGRVPPNELDAEAAVLSAIMLDPAALDVVLSPPDSGDEPLEPFHFYSDANKLIFETCKTLAASGRPYDFVTVQASLRARDQLNAIGGGAYLGQLVDATPAVANVQHHARIVVERKRLRLLIAACQHFAAHGYGEVENVRRFGDDLEQGVHDIVHVQSRSPMRGLRHVMAERFRQISDAATSGKRMLGIPTGFVDHDNKTGGLHRGDLVIVAARPGMGKTSMALNIATNIAAPQQESVPNESGYGATTIDRSRYGAAIFELEMPKSQVSDRFTCSQARVDLGKLRQGYLTADDFARLTEAGKYLGRLPIWIDATTPLTTLELRSKVRNIQRDLQRKGSHDGLEAEGLGLVVVDYLQLMKGSRWTSSREQEISEIARDLKNIAKELDVPLVALSQLNRGVESRAVKSKRPILADLRESGEIEQAADEVIFIYRDEVYNRETTDQKGIAELIIAKQRNGPTGTVRVRWVSGFTRFENLAPGEYEGYAEEAAE